MEAQRINIIVRSQRIEHMAEELKKHPVLTYLTFVLPMLLLAIGIVVSANILLMILTLAWLGVALLVLFLPIESDNGSTS